MPCLVEPLNEIDSVKSDQASLVITATGQYRGVKERANFGMVEVGAEKFGTNSPTPRQIWYKSPDHGTRTSTDREWWWVFATGLWMVAVISDSFWMVAWMPALITRRLLGTMEMWMPRALKATPRKMPSDPQIPRHNGAHFCCPKLCHSQASPVPNVPLPP